MTMIPKVREWRVTYWRVDSQPIVTGTRKRKLASCTVSTINKRLAKWAAGDRIGYVASFALLYPHSYIHVTVSLVREKGGSR